MTKHGNGVTAGIFHILNEGAAAEEWDPGYGVAPNAPAAMFPRDAKDIGPLPSLLV